MTQKIYPCLWFDHQAAEAAAFYCSVFANSKIVSQSSIVTTFESNGQKFMCLNGGPAFKSNPSISFYMVFDTIEEMDDAWAKLSEGGFVMMPPDKYPWAEKYGWVQDKFGFSWQLSFGNLQPVSQKFSPMFMFTGDQAGKAEEAVSFYTSVFKNSSLDFLQKYQAGENDREGLVKQAQFRLENYVFMAIDSSHPHGFGFNEALSIVVECSTQDEIDVYWTRLTEGGEESKCGWLKDRYGVSWQIVPAVLGKLMSDKDRAPRVMQAFLKMKKFNIAELEQA